MISLSLSFYASVFCNFVNAADGNESIFKWFGFGGKSKESLERSEKNKKQIKDMTETSERFPENSTDTSLLNNQIPSNDLGDRNFPSDNILSQYEESKENAHPIGKMNDLVIVHESKEHAFLEHYQILKKFVFSEKDLCSDIFFVVRKAVNWSTIDMQDHQESDLEIQLNVVEEIIQSIQSILKTKPSLVEDRKIDNAIKFLKKIVERCQYGIYGAGIYKEYLSQEAEDRMIDTRLSPQSYTEYFIGKHLQYVFYVINHFNNKQLSTLLSHFRNSCIQILNIAVSKQKHVLESIINHYQIQQEIKDCVNLTNSKRLKSVKEEELNQLIRQVAEGALVFGTDGKAAYSGVRTAIRIYKEYREDFDLARKYGAIHAALVYQGKNIEDFPLDKNRTHFQPLTIKTIRIANSIDFNHFKKIEDLERMVQLELDKLR